MFRPGVFAVASACIALSCVPVAQAKVGVTSVTDGEPLGQPPAASERILRVGIDVQASERVTTKADDRAHVVFLDGTSLTIGPNSVLVIDKYVYDPDRKTGDIALSTTRGVFRFVGGAISKNSEVTVKTPSATIGIRGGIVQFAVAENGATSANFLYGDTMRVTAQNVTTIANRTGSNVEVPANGQPTKAAIIQRGQMPSNQPLEKRPAAAPLPGPAGARAPVNQNAVNQNAAAQQNSRAQQDASSRQDTQTAQNTQPTTTAPQSTAPTRSPAPAPMNVASIGDTLDSSNFSQRNSKLTPRNAQVFGAYRPDVKGDPGQGRPGGPQGSPPPRQVAGKAGPPPTAFKPPPVIAKPQVQNATRAAVTNMTTRNIVQQPQRSDKK
jgi:hypothetical protein